MRPGWLSGGVVTPPDI